jgi:hypothetical protein
MERIPQSVAIRVLFKAFNSSDHVTPATGQTIAVVISKNGAAFGNPSGGATNATEISNGWYYADLSTTDTGTTGPLIVRGTCSAVDDIEPQPYNVVNANNAGFSGVPNGQMMVKKNVQLTAFTFPIFDSTTHQMATGKTITAQVSIDGGSLGSCTNAVSELSGGLYKITLAAADLNGNVIALKFSGTGCDDLPFTILTQP